MIAPTSSHRFVDELVRLRRLLSNGVNGVLEDLALALLHGRMLARGDDSLAGRAQARGQSARMAPSAFLSVSARRQHLGSVALLAS
jgi:hypothetical protein